MSDFETRLRAGIEAAMEDALREQKSLGRYVGIFTIVMLVTYVLLVIDMIVFAIIYGSMQHQ